MSVNQTIEVAPAPRTLGTRLRGLAGHRAVWPLLALALILAVNGLVSPGFFSIRVVEGRFFGSTIDILYRAMPTAMVALGMAVVIGSKGIDLSVGAIIAICGATIAWRIHAGDPHVVVLLWALGAGLLCGLWNGALVALLGIQPIVATLVLMVSGRGIGLMINLIYGGTNPSFESPFLQSLSVGHVGLIPTRLLLGAASFAALWLLLRRTALGLFIEAVGGNARAADLAGIGSRLVTYSAYLISGLTAGWAGVILTADTHISDPVSQGLYIELDAILAVVIGGGSLAGGRIHLGMTVIGTLIIQALATLILTSGVPPEYNLVVKAVVVLAVLLLQSDDARAALTRRNRARGSLGGGSPGGGSPGGGSPKGGRRR
ncbi:monosaccharide ABC transporter membrane protein, CUT2 family [Tistlia consotensis]|uniref:Monosaccharide ABC transporter membrane protein, CUT2 family n=1 Tax=Tistlia consotensis USBA 355 TaxID=560819 RepID=A0A1Y6CHQ3_9PROT|nr:ABC transporter permease [Tistlia consotensis]SMF56525.1 monosaccharide ABC transporter membrane protein, CUT2 family [Tistlia consotensis USBA 355]SNR44699.1 monosaccharide ABC transporter membrane protein, CUT2 family [Tistlia consotensis]